MTEYTWQVELREAREQWASKLSAQDDKHFGYAHFTRTVEILEGNPPPHVLYMCANDWQYPPFGGRVERGAFGYTDELGLRHRAAIVSVHTD